MPPIKRRSSPSGGNASTRIPIFSLSSGVSTQPSSKRLPIEAEALDNALISLERSFEKRPGFEIVQQQAFTGTNQIIDGNRLDLFKLYNKPNIDIFWTWFTINEDNRFLIGINYKATASTDILFYVFKINQNNWEDITPTSNSAKTEQDSTIVSSTTREYVTFGNTQYKSKDVLKVTTVGSSLVVLNNKVKAGFTSGKNGFTINLDGTETTTKDTKGQKVTYYTSTLVMGNTGNLEALTSTQDLFKYGYDYVNYSSSGTAITGLTTITLPLNIDSRIIGENSNISIHAMSGSSYLSNQYLTGSIEKLHNSDINNLSFADTPDTFKKTIYSLTINGSAPAYSSLLNSVPVVAMTSAIPTSLALQYVGTGVLIFKSTEEWLYGYLTYYNSGTNAFNMKITHVSETWKNTSGSFSLSGTDNIAFECADINITSFTNELASNGSTITNWLVWFGSYLPVEDFKYKDPAQPWLGQSFADFSEIRFPTEPTEVFANNSSLAGKSTSIIDQSAREMLSALYDDKHPLKTQIYNSGTYANNFFGLGKIYYTAGPYLTQASGYYRVINFPETQKYKLGNTTISGTGRPYTQKVRSPDICSVIDERRMPQKLSFDASPEGINKDWYFGPIKWKERTNGDRDTNPGPSVFLNSDKTDARHININTITTYRDRLYFASGDVVFSSQLGIYEDLFLQDPSNIVSSDPIDIRASSKTYCEIVALVPFSDFLFVNTKADIQFELRGSENQITPLTAQITPTAFYSTARLTDPMLMGSLIYFFDKSRLYMYLAQQGSSLSTAEEISTHCIGYLPTNYRAPCVAPAHNSIIFVDDDSPNYIYLYTNRFSADRVLQNSFYRYILNSGDSVESTQVYDNYLYIVVKKTNTKNEIEYYIQKSYLGKQDISIPRLDNLFKLSIYENSNSFYNSTTNETTFYLNFPYTVDTTKVLIITDSSDNSWGENKYTILKPTVTINPNGIGSNLIVKGNYISQNSRIYIGTTFTMNVELSTQFVRDQNNNIIDGILNLKTLTLRHFDTGNYDIVATRREKSVLKSSFSAITSNAINDKLSIENTQKTGEFVAKILGYSDTTSIKIVSDYPTPVNIINMEFKGKFKQKYTSLGT